MKYVDIMHTTNPFSVITDNKLIEANIIDIHVEITLEDNSMIIFSNDSQYYDFIGDPKIYSVNEINIAELLDNYENVSDITTNFSYAGENVLSITEINYDNEKLYYLQRSGLTE